ncbi:hypothetical protein [Thermotalea metallivorans]|uniref:hypothetical protein n=1 Tax=Thermotalea metallivorans TaxID=520762 RepID=UPI00083865DF|nr:hypothetical protein [Thermotalea metallivorans]
MDVVWPRLILHLTEDVVVYKDAGEVVKIVENGRMMYVSLKILTEEFNGKGDDGGRRGIGILTANQEVIRFYGQQ